MTLRIIGGRFKGRFLKAPKASTTRPTQGMLREAVFNICQNQIDGARFLDLFAGSGEMELEAISRGAASAAFVKQNRGAINCIKENIQTLENERAAEIVSLDAVKALAFLEKRKMQFDIVYIDPPYDRPIKDLLESLIPVLAAEAIIFIEERH